MKTLRIEYTKNKYMKYLGHLELMKLFERAFRFEKLPLKYSEGFNPLPRMTFASPLSVGYSSDAEIMEVQLTEEVAIEKVLNFNMPEGIVFKRAKYVECKQSLMAAIDYAEYTITCEAVSEINEALLTRFMGEEAVFYDKKTKKGGMKQVNLLEQLKAIDFKTDEENGKLVFKVILASGSTGSLNPEKFINTLRAYAGLDATDDFTAHRTNMYWTADGVLKPLFDLVDMVA